MKRIKQIAGIIGFVYCAGYLIYLQISNPDATEMRLLIDHWEEYGMIIFITLVSVGFTHKEKA